MKRVLFIMCALAALFAACNKNTKVRIEYGFNANISVREVVRGFVNIDGEEIFKDGKLNSSGEYVALRYTVFDAGGAAVVNRTEKLADFASVSTQRDILEEGDYTVAVCAYIAGGTSGGAAVEWWTPEGTDLLQDYKIRYSIDHGWIGPSGVLGVWKQSVPVHGAQTVDISVDPAVSALLLDFDWLNLADIQTVKLNVKTWNSYYGMASGTGRTEELATGKTYSLTKNSSYRNVLQGICYFPVSRFTISWAGYDAQGGPVNDGTVPSTALEAGKTTLITIDTDDGTVTTGLLYLSESELDFTDGGGTQSFNVKSDQQWTVESDETWCTVNPASGTGNAAVSVTVQSNTGTSYRLALVTVKAAKSNISRTLFVWQDGRSAGTLPVLTTSAATNITATGATLGGNITSAGSPAYTERGVCWGTAANPTTAGSKQAITGTGTGAFSAAVAGFTPGTTYYVRAYAVNTAGTAYGSQITFTTSAASGTLPVLTTSAATNIAATGATLGGNITDAGSPAYTERGVCWGTAANPTTAGSRQAITGTGTGAFSAAVTGLAAGASYYVRAYAVNTAGTAYGSQITFSTPIAVTGVTLNKTALTLAIGAKETLTATVLPDNAPDKTVAWTSNSTGVATVSASGEVTAVAAGTATVTVTTTDGGKTATCAVTVAVLPVLATSEAANITATGATLGGNISNAGSPAYTERGVCWGTAANPTTAGSKLAITGTGTGAFSTAVTGLTANTVYYVRAYAVNAAGTAYGSQITFTTPVAVTGVSLNKTALTLAAGARETLTATVLPANATDKTVSWTSNSTAVATVSASGEVTAVAAGTATVTATTTDGGKKATCTVTVTAPPTLTTAAAKGITSSGATLGGDIVNTGSPAYTERGVCWSTTANPTTADGKLAIAGTGTGMFSAPVTGLAASTVYHARAYAVNTEGTAYGADITFTTLAQGALPGNIIFVSFRGSDDNDGMSWAAPKKSISTGIAAAQAGWQVWVEAGNYTSTVTLKNGVNVYGGFDCTERSIDGRAATARSVLTGATFSMAAAFATPTVIDGFSINNCSTAFTLYSNGIMTNCTIYHSKLSVSEGTVSNSTIDNNGSSYSNYITINNNGKILNSRIAIYADASHYGMSVTGAGRMEGCILSGTIYCALSGSSFHGIHCSGTGDKYIVNCTFNLTFSSTYSSNGYGIGGDGSTSVANCIFMPNNNRIYSGTGYTTNNVTVVTSDLNSDLSPKPTSPVVNAGNNSYVTTDKDILGNPRIRGSKVDAGAIESEY